MKTKLLGILILLIVGLASAAAFASAQIDESTVAVYLDNIALEEGSATSFEVIERGETLPLKVQFRANETTTDTQNVEISAEILGDAHSDVIASETNVFDLEAGGRYTKKLDLKLTKRMDPGQYDIRVTIAGRTRDITVVKYYRINVDLPQHLVNVKDVVLSPEGAVKAGRALLVSVRVENNGDRAEDGVKVEASIPELQLSAATYIDSLEPEGQSDDETSSEELYLRIPECAQAGDYTMHVDVKYDDGDEVASTTKTIKVIPGDACTLTANPGTTQPQGPQTVIKVQDVSAGQGTTVYQMTLTNSGAGAKAYTINVNTGDKLDASIQPSGTVVVGAGDTESVIVFVTPKAGTAAGQYGFSVVVSSGSDVLKQIPLTATVAGAPAASGASNLKRGLEIGLVVLVVLLVILGLIIGFNKLKGDEQEDAEGTKTYY
jgi:uncharacterized membrane protein